MPDPAPALAPAPAPPLFSPLPKYDGPVANPLITAAIGAAAGAGYGGFTARKGKLLKHIIGGGVAGGALGLGAGTGAMLGGIGSNAITRNNDMSAPAVLGTQIAGRAGGTLAGGLLAMPIYRRIIEEMLAGEEEEEENPKTVAREFGKKVASWVNNR